MAVVTKIRINAAGQMKAGQFIESDEAGKVQLKANSDVIANEINEIDAPVRFTSEGKIIANELVEV